MDEKCDNVTGGNYIRPTSFAELDSTREASERAWHISSLTSDFSMIIDGILGSAAVEDKVAALSKATLEYQTRLTAKVGKKSILQGWIDSFTEPTKKEDGVSYRASDYAVSTDGDSAAWSLRLADGRSGAWSAALIQKALDTEDLSAAALERIEAAVKEMDSPELMKQVKTLRTAKESRYSVFKDGDNNWRWIGVATNRWQDRDDEIITEEAHREFKSWLDNNPDKAPQKWSWHTPWTAAKNRADWWDYVNGFFVYSGILTEEEAKAELSVTEPRGMSHGFWILGRDSRDSRFITKYRTFEVSDLVIGRVSNMFTDYAVISEE